MLEFETSRVSIADKYPMNVRYVPSVERFRASSDFEEKLVTSWSFCGGTPFCELLGTAKATGSMT